MYSNRARSTAFTLIELLVVIAIITVLISILLPGLAGARANARATACAAKLQQLGVGLGLYENDFDNTLPQAKGPLPKGGESVIGALFGGKKGTLPAYGIDTLGAELRPLNRYVTSRVIPPDADGERVEMPEFQSPVDKGALDVPFLGRVESYYELIGSSYTLNDHSLSGEEDATLVPLGGGKKPFLTQPSKTWAVGSHPIYNYQQGGDRRSLWYGSNRVEANLLFCDLHAKARLNVPPGVVNTTPDYTFLP